MTEREIQDFIWDNKDNWKELIQDFIFPHTYEFKTSHSIESISPGQLIYNSVINRLEVLYLEIKDLELLGVEVSLSKSGESTIRADFLGMEPGAPGIAIVELKKSRQTEREAFTELLAYSNHINTLFPTHTKDDTILILITPLEARIVKEAFLQTLLFEKKRVFIFIPEFSNSSNVKALKLRPYIPTFNDIVRLSEVAFAKRNFDVRVIVWWDTPDFWNNSAKNGEGRKDPTAEQKALMNSVSSLAAQFMEEKQINGFVYTSQCWPELEMPLPNSLVLVGLNPYKVANDLFYLENYPDIKFSDIPRIDNFDDAPSLSDFISGLKLERNEPMYENYISSLSLAWESHLFMIGQNIVDLVNLNVHKDRVSTDRGRMTWDEFESNFIENVACFNYDIRPTGLIRELYLETTKIDYNYWRLHKNHPIQGDIFNWAIETLVSHNFFSEFLERMFGDPYGSRNFDNEDVELGQAFEF